MNQSAKKFFAALLPFLMLLPLDGNAQLRTEENSKVVRDLEYDTEIVVCGGGLSGVCAAVSAALAAMLMSVSIVPPAIA